MIAIQARVVAPHLVSRTVISLSDPHVIRADAMPLLLAAGLALDTIYKEK